MTATTRIRRGCTTRTAAVAVLLFVCFASVVATECVAAFRSTVTTTTIRRTMRSAASAVRTSRFRRPTSPSRTRWLLGQWATAGSDDDARPLTASTTTAPQRKKRAETAAGASDRRTFVRTAASMSVAAVAGIVVASATTNVASAAEDAPQVLQFNDDGSLKDSTDTEAKFRLVEFVWQGDDAAASADINVDGTNLSPSRSPASSSEGGGSKKSVKISYRVPLKWDTGSGSTFGRAVRKITVYRPSGRVDGTRLEKAARIGVAGSLQVPSDLRDGGLASADLLSGRTATKVSGGDDGDGKIKYYEFDMASAPATCEKSKGGGSGDDNIELGLFCPYDTVFLLSAAAVGDRLYVMCIECDKDEWKAANSDLKLVRSSFLVTTSS